MGDINMIVMIITDAMRNMIVTIIDIDIAITVELYSVQSLAQFSEVIMLHGTTETIETIVITTEAFIQSVDALNISL